MLKAMLEKHYSSMRNLKVDVTDTETLLYTLRFLKSEREDMLKDFVNEIRVVGNLISQLEEKEQK